MNPDETLPAAATLRERAAADPSNVYDKYVRLRKVGQGGFGAVWEGFDTELKRRVALKFLHGQSEDGLARFMREARTAAKLSHRNVVSVYDVGEDHGERFIVMEYVDGGPPDPATLGLDGAVEVVRQAATAVHQAHELGIIHRDLKPANILVADGVAKVTDFGLAKPLSGEEAISLSGEIMGTPNYMAPEQAQARAVGPPADVYSLGATLYHLATGRPPFVAQSVLEILTQVVNDEPPPPGQLNSKIDMDLSTIVLKCLEKEPARRYASAGELAEDLRRFQAGEPIAARPASVWLKLRKRVNRNVPLSIATALAVLATLALVGYGVSRALAKSKAEARRERAMPHLTAGRQRLEDAERLLRAPGPNALEQARASAREAVEHFDRAAAEDPSMADATFGAGRAHHLLEEYEAAERDYSRTLEIEPAYASAYFHRGRLNLELYEVHWAGMEITLSGRSLRFSVAGRGRYSHYADRARADFERVLALQPHPRERAYIEGAIPFAEARWDEAIAAYDRAIEAFAAEEEFYYRRGAARFLTQGDRAQALVDLDAALQLRPTYAPALLYRGLIRVMFGRVMEGIDDLKAAERIDPDWEAPPGMLGYVYTLYSDHAAAVDAWTRVAALRPDDAAVLSKRAISWRGLGRFDDSLGDLDRALEIEPGNATLVSERGLTLWSMRDFDGALAAQNRAIEMEPTLATAWVNRGLVHKSMGRLDEALDDYTEAADLDPTNPTILTNLGNTLRQTGSPAVALAAYDRAIAADAAHAPGHFGRGNALHDLGRIDDSIAAFAAAVEADPAHVKARVNLGRVLLDVGRGGEALPHLRKAVELDPTLEPMLRGDIERSTEEF